MKISIIAAILIALAIFFFTRSPAVEVSHPARGPSVQAVFATGIVEASIMYPISSRHVGKLVELSVDEGAIVHKDQVLAKLQDDKLLNTVLELQARENFLQQEYNRQERLFKTKATAKDLLEKAKSELEAARAATKGALAQNDELVLKANIEGKVIRRDGEIGQLIAANQTVFWLSDAGPLRISAEVDEEDISKIQTGQKVLIRSDAFAEKIFNGLTDSITPKGDPIARSYRVRIKFSEDVPFLIGMTTENNIILDQEQNALLIPASAVIEDSVWLIKKNRLAKQKIVIGAKDLKQVQVISGLSQEDTLATVAKPEFKEGQKVRTFSKE